MRGFNRLASVVLALVGAGSISLPPAAATSYYEKTFTYYDTFFQSTDSVGTFSAQASFAYTGTPIAFSLTLTPALQALATGNMTCSAYQQENGSYTGVNDYHPNIPVSYFWHWTVPNNSYGPTYLESADCYFPVKGGQAHVGAVLTYWISDGGTGVPERGATTRQARGIVSLTVTTNRH